MDFTLFTLINNLAYRFVLLDIVGIFFAAYALPLSFLGVLLVGIKKRTFLIMTIVACALAYGANTVIGFIVVRNRPFVDHVVHKLIEKSASSQAFPSDHAALAFVLAYAFSSVYPRGTFLFYGGAFLIALARVFVGVHYPLDILGGAFVGVVSGFIIKKCFASRSMTYS